MGTLGGKIGFGFGLVLGVLALEPLIRLVLGACFFEQGCGDKETTGVALVAAGSITVAVVAGVLLREVINLLLPTSR